MVQIGPKEVKEYDIGTSLHMNEAPAQQELGFASLVNKNSDLLEEEDIHTHIYAYK